MKPRSTFADSVTGIIARAKLLAETNNVLTALLYVIRFSKDEKRLRRPRERLSP